MAKIPVGMRLDADLIERLKNAIWYIGEGLTIGGVAEEAIEQAVRRLEKRNGGKPFPPRGGELARSPKANR